MRISMPLLCAVLATAALAADGDPWLVPTPAGAELLVTMEKSSHSYTLSGVKTQWDGANGPEREELPLANDERDGLAKARELATKGDHDAAVKAADELIAKNAANWEAHLVRAASLHAKGADADALAALRTSLIGNRRRPEAWKLLDDVAAAMSKKVARPKLDVRGWVRDKAKDETEVGSVFEKDADMPWTYYAAARAVYRWDGRFTRDFPAAKSYAFTFREQMFAMCVLAAAADVQRADGKANSEDLKRVVAERKARTLTEFTFFAVWPEPLSSKSEPGLDALRPRLEKYFDEKVLLKR
jgi:hypothetical protein